jgi:hypothetical protein
MATYIERDNLTILDSATDPEGDPLSITAVNGSTTLLNSPIPLSVGGAVIVASDGSVVFDDTGFTWPGSGSGLYDSIIATVSDGTNDVSVTVNIQINHP